MYRRAIMTLLAAAAVACATTGCATTKPRDNGPQTVMFSPPPEAQESPDMPNSMEILEDERPATEAPAPPAGGLSEGGELVVKRADVQEGLKRGPGWALGQVRVTPSRDDSGGFVGFEIAEFSPEAGGVMSPPLVVGDVITHLMGVRLKSPDDYMSAWQVIGGSDTIRIDYVRAGSALFSEWRVED